MKKCFFVLAALFVAAMANAQVSKMLGQWTTIDDATGQKMAVVNLYQAKDGLYYGKIVQILAGPQDEKCVECEGAEHNKPILGLVIIRGMKEDGDKLVGGKILDPNNGKFYYVKISLQGGKLVLRGSLDKAGLLGRNQTWVR